MNTFFKGDNSDFHKNFRMKDDISYLAFGMTNKQDGDYFIAEVKNSDQSTHSAVVLPHTSLDAYIYALGELKQELELARIRNGKV